MELSDSKCVALRSSPAVAANVVKACLPIRLRVINLASSLGVGLAGGRLWASHVLRRRPVSLLFQRAYLASPCYDGVLSIPHVYSKRARQLALRMVRRQLGFFLVFFTDSVWRRLARWETVLLVVTWT